MIAMQFFPSRTVSFYMAKTFIVRTFAVLAALVLVLQFLDALSESGTILAHPGNGQAEVWRYISMRTPQIISRFLPYSVLLGAIITYSTLNQNSEVIALKASGLSAHQILAPMIVAAFGVAALSFAFDDRIVSRATATLDAWKKVDYAQVPVDHGDRGNVWTKAGEDLIHVTSVKKGADAPTLVGVTFYDRDAAGRLISTITADHGQRDGKGWRIWPARKFDVATGQLSNMGSVVVADGVRPDQFTLANVDAEGLSFLELKSTVSALKAAGRQTKSYEGELWHKLSSPLSAVLMPLLGAVAAFGLARSGKLFIRAVIGMALGFTYFVVDNFALAMGNLGAYPPFLAAWAPFLLFLMIGEAVLIRTEE
ncbi:LPS export ABC transporter permease LptG [Sphingomonas sp.]|jgi:lipopolysaccharide export system permease protein|uniref:LPS export ABC transporter permease LptG n=1 Tax=Sphingomonas sp. TaxID=28214 RepID=UPI002E306F53|nr:LPS export ABC transporter permease LptG [Sphingomonas sp.]HEX4695823.1 LPS export ABC transporter permease LptG [Sphingomonas sp.]